MAAGEAALGSLDQAIVSTALPTIVGDPGGWPARSWSRCRA
jgi:hypothetical protein